MATLLDDGNIGLFPYPIDHIGCVVATDLFVEDAFAKHYSSVEWRQGSALEIVFAERFDTAIAIDTLHHMSATACERPTSTWTHS